MFDILFVIIISIFVLFLGLITFLGDTNNNFRRHFFFLCISMSLWQFFVLLSDIPNAYSLITNKLVFLGPVFIVFFLWQITKDLWLLSELKILKSVKSLNIIVYIGVAILVVLSLSSYVVGQINLRTNINESGYDIIRGEGYYVYIILLLVMFFFCIARLLFIFFNTKINNIKKQSIMILLAMILTGLVTVVTSLIIPVVTGTSKYSYLSSISLLIFTITIFFAIVKYQAIETKIIVVRAVAYVLSLLFLAMILFAFVYLIISSINLSYNISIGVQFLYMLITLSLAVAYPFIKKFFDKWTNSFFYQNNYDLDLPYLKLY